MQNFCLDLKEDVTKIINYEKKEMIPLTKKKRTGITCKKFSMCVKEYLIPIITTKNTIK